MKNNDSLGAAHLWRQLFHNADEGLLLVTQAPEGSFHLVEANQRAESLLGFESRCAAGKKLCQFTSEEVSQILVRLCREAVRSTEHREAEDIVVDSAGRHLQITAVWIANGATSDPTLIVTLLSF